MDPHLTTAEHLAIIRDGQAQLLDADLALVDAATDEPHLIEHFTAELVSAALAADVPEAELIHLAADRTTAGMSDRALFRLRWNEAGESAALPPSVFVKATPAERATSHRTYLSVLHMDALETRFFNELRRELPDIAPRSYYARSYGGGRFLIALEDLTARGMRLYAPGDDVDLGHARAIIKALARLHATFWETPRFTTDLAWIRPQLFRYGFAWMREAFHRARLGLPAHPCYPDLPASVREMTSLLDVGALSLYRYWSGLPATVLHGDSHLGNTYSGPDGAGGLLDWQSLFRGHGVRDVAYFIAPALPVALRRAHEHELVDLYLETLAGHKVILDRDRTWELYRLFLLEAWDAHVLTIVVGTFGHRTEETGRRVLAALTDNDVPELLHTFFATAA